MALGSVVPTPYHRHVRPTACPRCARASDAWTFERDQGLAGCPCGEVIPYVFDDAPLEEVSKARVSLGAAAIGGPVAVAVALLAMAAVFAWTAYQNARPWTFAIEGGRFRAEARGHRTEIPLEDVQRFSVAAVSPKTKRKAADARARFELVVSRTNGERVRVPLFVEGPHEAQFIADRANALLATDGRTIDGDYRGEHVRVGEVVACASRTLQAPRTWTFRTKPRSSRSACSGTTSSPRACSRARRRLAHVV
jgi:hypothetical protein